MIELVCFSPHPDDAELSCGGWLALAADRGQSVGIVDLSAGELATNGSVAVRAAEAAAAAGVLGLSHRENLGLPDGHLAVVEDQVRAVVEVLRRLRPALALAPWTHARHPDHAATGALLQRAVFHAGLAKYAPELGSPHRPRLLHYPQRHEVRPDFVVDITAVVDRKRAAIAAHVSQVGPGAATLVNQPVGHGAWDVRDRYWGATIGVAYGEPYLLGTPVPLSDPLAHFAAHPALPALVPPR
ncbi:MAG: bacillithiol biosynthesis deacetylase BshB1 [Myxococcota bacterium]